MAQVWKDGCFLSGSYQKLRLSFLTSIQWLGDACWTLKLWKGSMLYIHLRLHVTFSVRFIRLLKSLPNFRQSDFQKISIAIEMCWYVPIQPSTRTVPSRLGVMHPGPHTWAPGLVQRG